jgi:hypothetical protein
VSALTVHAVMSDDHDRLPVHQYNVDGTQDLGPFRSSQ